MEGGKSLEIQCETEEKSKKVASKTKTKEVRSTAEETVYSKEW
jgi:hypothetical protein